MEFNLAWQENLLSECNVCTVIKEGREKTFNDEIRNIYTEDVIYNKHTLGVLSGGILVKNSKPTSMENSSRIIILNHFD